MNDASKNDPILEGAPQIAAYALRLVTTASQETDLSPHQLREAYKLAAAALDGAIAAQQSLAMFSAAMSSFGKKP